MCSRNLARVRATNLKDDANRVLNYLLKGDVERAKYILTDMKEGINLLREARSSGLDVWEAVVMILFILKDIAIVGGILGTIIWYIKGKNAQSR